MKLMTEVFDAWTAERLYAQQQLSKPYAQPYPYQQAQPYPQTQYPQSHSPYHVSPQPTNMLMSPPLTPMTPLTPLTPNTPNSPLPVYTSPNTYHSQVNSVNQYLAPQARAIEMPAELPDNLQLAAPTPVPVRPVSGEVSDL